MSRLYGVALSFILFSANAFAMEPVMVQQGMVYFSMSFDAGTTTKTDHDFGFRLDRELLEPGETISMSQLHAKPAVMNLKLNANGLKAFELHGVDYSYEDYVYHGAEGGEAKTSAKTGEGAEAAEPVPEPEAAPKRKLDVPLGVIIGVGIGAIAIGSGF